MMLAHCHSRAFTLVALLAAVPAGGCAGGEDATLVGEEWAAAIDTVGDTIVVRTVTGSAWRGTRWLVPKVTFGTLEGEDAYMFGDISSLAAGPDGSIYLVDSQVPVIRQYAPDGTFIRDIGREGGGPGEYQRPESLRTLSDGRIVVRDPANVRNSVYSASGEFLAAWILPSGGGWSTSDQMVIDREDRVVSSIIANSGTGPTEWKYAMARSADGPGADTLMAPTWDFESWVVTGESENSRSMTSVPYGPSSYWDYSPLGYFVGGLNTEYRIDLLRQDAPVLRIEKDWLPVPVNAADAAERRRSIEDRFRRRFPGWSWNGPDVPDFKPAFRSILVAEDGRIWVLLHNESYEHITREEAAEIEDSGGAWPNRFRETVSFDVFEPDGRYLGRVQTQRDFQTYPEPFIRGDTVWAVTADELEVQRVNRFELEPAG